MPATLPHSAEAASPAASLAVRNHELLEFRDPALNLAYRISGNAADAEDILQDAYLRAVKARLPILSGSTLRNWFFQITANAARDWLRSDRSRRNREREAAMDHSLRAVAPPASATEAEELKQQVEAELERIDEKFRLPVSLHYEHGMSYEDTAAVLGLTPGTVRVYTSQGIQELRDRLGTSGRPVTAEILLGLLGAGLVLKASPALAASVEAIVAQGAATGAAATAAKAVSLSGKPFAIIAAPAKTGLLIYAGIATAACMGLLAVVGWFAYNQFSSLKRQNSAQAEPLTNVHADELDLKRPPPPVSVEAPAPVYPPPVVPAPAPMPMLVADYKMPPDQEAAWAGADDLIPMADPAHYAVAGSWVAQDGSVLSQPANFARMAIPYIAPEEYDYRIDFTRKENVYDVNMIFPVQGAQCIWRMDSWGSCYFGIFKDNPNAVPIKLATGARHTAIVEVRKTTLSGYLDGQLIKTIVIGKSPSLCQEDFRLPDKRLIGIGTWANLVVFHRIAVRAVTGQGETLGPDPDAANAISEAYWRDAVDVLPKAYKADDAVGGKWRVDNGALAVLAEPYSRYRIDYLPPEEYDYRVVFTRIAGRGEFAQIVAAANTQFIWKVDSNGMSILDAFRGGGWENNPTFLHTPGAALNGMPHSSVVCVRKTGVKTFVDGKLLANFTTDYADLSIENIWKIKNPHALGVGFHNSMGSVAKIQIKEITGKGQWVEAGAGAENKGGAF